MTTTNAHPQAAMPADSHGAVDLSSHTPTNDSSPAPHDDIVSTRLDLPLIVDATDQTFEPIMQASNVVPVVLVFWTPASLESRGAVEMMETVTRNFAGRFQLVKIDIAQGQGVAQAFQIRDLPAVAALIGGRPVPIFQGQSTEEQVRPVMEELLSVAAQMGINAGIRVSEEDTTPPIPDEHLPARNAEAAGDLEGAVAAWDKLLEHHPHDQVALAEVARLRLQLREQNTTGEQTLADRADSLFAAGDHTQAFDLLLGVVANTPDPQEKDAARARLIDLFRIAGSTESVRRARQRLSALLMI